jgi:hypothetical protein
MANEPIPEFQKLGSKQTVPLRLEYGNRVQQYSDAEAVMELVRRILIATVRQQDVPLRLSAKL